MEKYRGIPWKCQPNIVLPCFWVHEQDRNGLFWLLFDCAGGNKIGWLADGLIAGPVFFRMLPWKSSGNDGCCFQTYFLIIPDTCNDCMALQKMALGGLKPPTINKATIIFLYIPSRPTCTGQTSTGASRSIVVLRLMLGRSFTKPSACRPELAKLVHDQLGFVWLYGDKALFRRQGDTTL